MKDTHDQSTKELPMPITKAERFRAKQAAAGLRQYSFWLTERESEAVKAFLTELRGK